MLVSPTTRDGPYVYQSVSTNDMYPCRNTARSRAYKRSKGGDWHLSLWHRLMPVRGITELRQLPWSHEGNGQPAHFEFNVDTFVLQGQVKIGLPQRATMELLNQERCCCFKRNASCLRRRTTNALRNKPRDCCFKQNSICTNGLSMYFESKRENTVPVPSKIGLAAIRSWGDRRTRSCTSKHP